MIDATAVRRFFLTPKGLLLLLFGVLLAFAAPPQGLRLVGPSLAGAVIAAVVVDLLILRTRERAWLFPSGAILTGLIVAMVSSPHEPWFVAAWASAIGIVSKYVVRIRAANVFNPAALGLVATFYLFHAGQSWWGALPEIAPVAILVLFATGIFMADRVNKMPMVLAFLGGYYLLFTVTAFVGNPGHVAGMFRAPDLHASLFFAFFILTDPPTSPTRYRDQIICGLLVAVASYGIFEWNRAVYYLLGGVLVGNVWEAWRRWQIQRTRGAKSARERIAGQVSALPNPQ